MTNEDKKSWLNEYKKRAELLEAMQEIPIKGIKQFAEIREKQEKVLEAISNLSDDREKAVMIHKYICGKTFNEIGKKMYYSSKSITRIHKKALQHIEVVP